jgi:hypothetical protein
LPDEQKALRLLVYQEFIQSVDDDHSLFDSHVTADKTWFFQYDPRIEKAWSGARQAFQDTKNFDFKNQKNKVILVTFFYSQGNIHKEFFPPCQMVNKEYFVEILSRLVQGIHPVKTSVS